MARVRHETRDVILIHYSYPPPGVLVRTFTKEPNTASSDHVLTIGGGADLVYPRTSRVAVVGSARLRWRERNSHDHYYGVSACAFVFSAGMRVRF